MQAKTKIDQEKLKRALALLRCFDRKFMATDLLEAIHKNGGSATVSEIEQMLSWDQSWVSQRIKPLRESGILHGKRKGKWIHYHINYERIEQIRSAIKNFDFESTNGHVDVTRDHLKRKILKALQSSDVHNVIGLCARAGISTNSYYKYNLNKDEDIQTALSVNKMENGLAK